MDGPSRGSGSRSAGKPGRSDAPQPTERRPLTVMFCDIVDSVSLSQRLDPEDLMALIERYQTLCDDIVSDRGGFLAKFMGDGVLAYFGYPRAGEDDAANAVHAALDIVAAVRELERDTHVALEARVGIASGLVVLRGRVSRSRQRTVEVVGRILNLAARLQAAAPPGGVLIADATRHITRGLFSYRDLGAISLRGFPEPQQAWQVEQSNEAVSRFQARLIGQPTPFVGRREEWRALERCWSAAQKGAGQVVELVGDAGLGKSRLIGEFDRSLGPAAARRVTLHGSPERVNTAFRPVARELERAAGFERRDTPAAKLGKLGRLLGWPRNPDPLAASIFAALLGLPHDWPSPFDALTPEKRREVTMEALLKLALGWTGGGPLLLIAEDAHWIDASTLGLLGRLIERARDRPVLVAVTARPEFHSPWRESGRSTVVPLAPLDGASARAVCAHVCAGALPGEVVSELVERAGGIPFYMEELTRLIVERTAGAEDEDGARIPISLRDSLVARLDRLGPARRFASIGAVIGRFFSYDLMAAVANAPTSQTRAAMGTLKRAGVVGQEGAGEGARYFFRHALMRDAAYDSMLRLDRRALHQQVATALQSKFADLCEAEPETLAHHLLNGAKPTDAIPYLMKAGGKAAARGGHQEAVAHYRAARELIGQMPEGGERLQSELACLAAFAQSHVALRGYAAEEARDALTRAREICGLMGDAAHLFPVLHLLAKYWTIRGDHKQGEALIRACVRIAEETGQPHHIVESDATLGYILCLSGQLGDELTMRLERAVRVYDENEADCQASAGETNSKTFALCVTITARCFVGDLEGADRARREALNWARSTGLPYDLAQTLNFGAVYLIRRGEFEKALRDAQQAVEICEAHGFVNIMQTARAYMAMALAELGDAEKANEIIVPAITGWRRMGCNSLLGIFTEYHARIELKRGRLREAMELADAAVELDIRHQDLLSLPAAYEARARVHCEKPVPDRKAAEADLLRGLEVARANGARFWIEKLGARLEALRARHETAAE